MANILPTIAICIAVYILYCFVGATLEGLVHAFDKYMTRKRWIIIQIGALAALVSVTVLHGRLG